MGPLSLAAALALSLLSLPAPGACGDSYAVVRHDTLYSIARRCGSSVDAIARANRIDPTRIAVGQRLVMPGRIERGRVGQPQARPIFYRFQRGDTLYSLARWARVDLPALLAANAGIDPRDIDAGTAIRLPAGAVAPEPARLRERGAAHAAVPPPPRPPRAAPPPRPREDEEVEEGKPDSRVENGESNEPEGL